MLALWQQILVALIGGLVGGLAGGGLISAYLDWRRFQREQEDVRKEERRVAIDRIRSLCSVTLWDRTTTKGEKLELYMYRNNLEGTVREYIVLLEFAIRNLTNESVIVTRVETEEPGLTPLPDFSAIDDDETHSQTFDVRGNLFPEVEGTDFVAYDAEAFYDWNTKEEKDRTEVDYATLEPKGTTSVAYVAIRRFCALRKLEKPPTKVSIVVRSTEDHEVSKAVNLEDGQLRKMLGRVDEYLLPWGSFPRTEWEKSKEEIPF